MSRTWLCTRLTIAAAAGWALFAVGITSSTAMPDTDRQGFVDSAARCAAPDTAVVLGSTATSRVAVCETASGQYEYRGVQVSDGAKVIVPAAPSGDGGFVAENDGISYAVTADSLAVSNGNTVVREEPMLYFHRPKTAQAPQQRALRS